MKELLSQKHVPSLPMSSFRLHGESFVQAVVISVSSKPYSGCDIFWQFNKGTVDLDLDSTGSAFPWQWDHTNLRFTFLASNTVMSVLTSPDCLP